MFRCERAQSEVLGTVLLLGVTILVVGSTVALGSVALTDSQQTADLQRVEGAMTQFDSKASLVAHGESPTQMVQMDVGRTADFRVDEDAGWMRIEVETDEGENDINETVRFGAVVYESGSETVAYQGGGVWRSNADGSWMVSPPEFHYRGSGGTETLTLPLVTIEDGDGPLADTVRITDTEQPSERIFPSKSGSNPLLGGNVTITVESDYAEAWGRFFESRTDASVESLDGNRTRIRLPTEIESSQVTQSLFGLNTGSGFNEQTLMEDINSFNAASYDSRDYPPSEATGDNVRVYADGGIDGGAPGQLDVEHINIGGTLSGSDVHPSTSALESAADLVTEEAVGTTRHVDMSGEITDRIETFRSTFNDLNETATDGDPESYEDTASSIELGAGETEALDSTYVDGPVSVEGGALTVEGDLHVNETVDLREGGTLIVNGDLYVGEGLEVVTSTMETHGSLTVNGNATFSGATDATLRGDTYVNEALIVKESSSMTVEGEDVRAVEINGDIELIGSNDGTEIVLNTGERGDEFHLLADGDVLIGSESGSGTLRVAGNGIAYLHGTGDVLVESNGAPTGVNVVDEATAQWYHDGSVFEIKANDHDAVLESDAARNYPGGGLWLFSSADTVRLKGNAEDGSTAYVNGVLHANGVVLDDETRIDGALSANDVQFIDADVTLNHDEAIEDYDPFVDRTIPTVNHLHVSVHGIDVGGERSDD